MRTYDPLQGMVYRHIAGTWKVQERIVAASLDINRLPAGYANRSPRTFLGQMRTSRTAA